MRFFLVTVREFIKRMKSIQAILNNIANTKSCVDLIDWQHRMEEKLNCLDSGRAFEWAPYLNSKVIKMLCAY